jgi:hypothetical protein
MPGPRGIIIVKGSFEVSDLYDREFHKMAQNFGMIANYAEKAKKHDYRRRQTSQRTCCGARDEEAAHRSIRRR